MKRTWSWVLCVGLCLVQASPALAQLVPIRIQAGTQPMGRFGFVTCKLPDLDGDGVADYAVGAPQADRVFLYSGSTGALLRTLHGAPASRFGSALAVSGDLDGDGSSELLVGARSFDMVPHCRQGRVSVHSLATGAELRAHVGLVQLSGTGVSVAVVGDVDGDGLSDYVIGSPQHLGLGRYVVYSGATGGELSAVDATNAVAGLGRYLVPLGDVDLDGTADFAVSHHAGVLAVSGATHGTIWSVTRAVDSLARVGDHDGDGRLDLACADSDGLVEVLSATSGAVLVVALAPPGHLLFGRGMSAFPDGTGDGVPEIAIGAPFASGPQGEVFSGAIGIFDGSSGALVAQFTDLPACSAGGGSLTLLDDVNCDGSPDLLVGAERYAPPDKAGAVIILAGNLVPQGPQFVRGDANSDGSIDTADAVAMLGYLFLSASVACAQAGDADDNGRLTISDPVILLGHLFGGGPLTLPAPWPGCGVDPTTDALCCAQGPVCP